MHAYIMILFKIFWCICSTIDQVMDLAAEHERWLDAELEDAQQSQCRHLVIFQHIPWYIKEADEPKEYFNIDLETRKRMLNKFKTAGALF